MFHFYNNGSGAFGVLFYAVFLIGLCGFVFVLVRNIRQRVSDSRSPRLAVDARVVSRRQDTRVSQTPVGGDATGAQGFSTTTYTDYYVTFAVESGDTMEFCVPYEAYMELYEGSSGRLRFQGTRYLGFDRM